jgi:hypothetical protein
MPFLWTAIQAVAAAANSLVETYERGPPWRMALLDKILRTGAEFIHPLGGGTRASRGKPADFDGSRGAPAIDRSASV